MASTSCGSNVICLVHSHPLWMAGELGAQLVTHSIIATASHSSVNLIAGGDIFQLLPFAFLSSGLLACAENSEKSESNSSDDSSDSRDFGPGICEKSREHHASPC